jgi:lysozyme
MSPSQNLVVFTTNQEGVVLHPYLDQAGIATIGIGTTIYPNGKKVTMQDPSITLEQAQAYLMNKLIEDGHDVTSFTQGITLNQNQFDALCDFVYNAGDGAFQGSTLRKRILANPEDPTITAAFLMWDKIHVDGQIQTCQDLIERRTAEAKLYFTPVS